MFKKSVQLVVTMFLAILLALFTQLAPSFACTSTEAEAISQLKRADVTAHDFAWYQERWPDGCYQSEFRSLVEASALFPDIPQLNATVRQGGYSDAFNGHNGDPLGFDLVNALIDFSVSTPGISPDVLRIEYVCHRAQAGDSPSWLSNGEHCAPPSETWPILGFRMRLAGPLARFYSLEYDCRNKVTLEHNGFHDSQTCGLPGNGGAWNVRATVRLHKIKHPLQPQSLAAPFANSDGDMMTVARHGDLTHGRLPWSYRVCVDQATGPVYATQFQPGQIAPENLALNSGQCACIDKPALLGLRPSYVGRYNGHYQTFPAGTFGSELSACGPAVAAPPAFQPPPRPVKCIKPQTDFPYFYSYCRLDIPKRLASYRLCFPDHFARQDNDDYAPGLVRLIVDRRLKLAREIELGKPTIGRVFYKSCVDLIDVSRAYVMIGSRTGDHSHWRPDQVKEVLVSVQPIPLR